MVDFLQERMESQENEGDKIRKDLENEEIMLKNG